MNKWKSFIAGQVQQRPTADPDVVLDGEEQQHGSKRGKRYTKDDARAKKKKIQRRRAKKGYK